MTFKTWLLGLLNAAVSGAASSLAVGLADPEHFNLTSLSGLKYVGIVAGSSAIVSLAKYLYQNRIPGAPPSVQP